MLFIMSKSTKKSYFIRRLRLFCKCNYAIIITLPVIIALAFYAVRIEPDTLRIKKYTFRHEKVTPELDGTVIAFAADLHANHRRHKLWLEVTEFLNSCNENMPILLGGDLINGNGKGFRHEKVLDNLKILKNPSRIYIVPGNHEYRRYGKMDTLRQTFNDGNFIFMQDTNVIITTSSGGKFNLAGLDFMTNPHKRIDRQRTVGLLRDDMLNIVLTHTPEDFPFLPEKAHLVLAGHTHGGQIYLPFLGSVINPPGYPRKYTYGEVNENGKKMLVSSGLGSAYTQARFYMKPEIVLITLKSTNKK